MLYIQAWQDRFDRLLIIRIPIAMASLHQFNSNLYQFIISTIPDINFKPCISHSIHLIASFWVVELTNAHDKSHLWNIAAVIFLLLIQLIWNRSWPALCLLHYILNLQLRHTCVVAHGTLNGRCFFLLADLVILIGILVFLGILDGIFVTGDGAVGIWCDESAFIFAE